ncbi:DUF6221 family protein [Streptomyces sp. NPDC002533]
MDGLVQFLRNRLDEDEQTARAATWDEWDSAHWTARPPQADYERYIVADYLDDGVVVVTPENADPDGVGRHIARHDPARVLREIDAKRQILDEYANEARVMEQGHRTGWTEGGQAARETVLKLLAVAYADHPDYRDTWKP